MSRAKKYEEFQKELQFQAKDQKQLEEYVNGAPCLAFHPFDQMWCRATILNSDPIKFIVLVKCVDDGAIFCVTDKSHLKAMSILLLAELYFGYRCSLAMTTNLKRKNEATQHLFRIMNSNLNCREVVNYNGLRYVELFQDGRNLTDFFVENGVGKRLVVVPSGFAYINYIESPESFSIQMERDLKDLHRIKDFAKKYSQLDVTEPKVGMLVLARFEVDRCWYRAKIIAKQTKCFDIYFIDYGHCAAVTEIRAIGNQEISEIPAIAIKCSLNLPQGFKSLNNDAKNKFIEIADDGKKKIDVKLIEPGEKTAKIEIYIDGANILDKLFS
jgi:Tudor domain